MPLGDDDGEIVNEFVETLAPPAHPIRATDLSPMGDDEFWSGYEAIENDVERGLKKRYGRDYLKHWDPFQMHVSDLRREEQDSITGRIDELSGAQAQWRQGHGPKMTIRPYNTPTGRLERSPAGRHDIAPEEWLGDHIDPRLLMQSQQTVRFDRARSNLLAERYFTAGTQYRPHVMKHIQQQLEHGFSPTGKTLILDVEAPGLDSNEGIWQYSARMMENGRAIEGSDRTFHFPNPKMQWGGVIGADASSLEEYLSRNELGDYETQMRELMGMAQEADAVGGHNVLFDFRMLSAGMKNRASYGRDEEYTNLVDMFHRKFYDETTHQIGNVIDTNVLARNLIPNIPSIVEGPSQFSLQNILLHTDLLQQIKDKEGDETVAQWLTRGTHFADVDVPIEAHLMTALEEHNKFLRGQGGRELRMASGPLTLQNAEEQGFISRGEFQRLSYSMPVGPNINLSEIGHIHPSLLKRVQEAKLIDYDAGQVASKIRLTPIEQMVALQRDLTMGSRVAGASEVSVGRESKIRQAKKALWDVDTPEDAFAYGDQVGMWDRISKPWQTKGGRIAQDGVFPTQEGWKATQREFSGKGIPFAGMSWPERTIAAGLGEAGHVNMGARERDIRSVFGADVASLGRFVEPKGNVIRLAGDQSQIATVPMRFLEEWEGSRLAAGEEVSTAFTRPFEKTQWLHLSPFIHSDKSTDEIALMFDVPEAEKESLKSFLINHPEVSGDKDLVDRISASFRNNTGTYGVQVGTLGGLRGGEDVSKLAETVRQLAGAGGVDKSDQTHLINVAYAGRNITGGQEGAGALYVAGATIKRELLTPEEEAAIPGQVQAIASRYKGLHDTVDQGRTMEYFRTIKKRGASGEEGVSKMYRAMQATMKRAPLLIGAAALAGGGYYLHERGKKNKIYDETMTVQPLERSGWSQRNQANEMPRNPRVRPDYLSTAKVVRNLDANKVNHTSMAPNKYDYLYQTGM